MSQTTEYLTCSLTSLHSGASEADIMDGGSVSDDDAKETNPGENGHLEEFASSSAKCSSEPESRPPLSPALSSALNIYPLPTIYLPSFRVSRASCSHHPQDSPIGSHARPTAHHHYQNAHGKSRGSSHKIGSSPDFMQHVRPPVLTRLSGCEADSLLLFIDPL